MLHQLEIGIALLRWQGCLHLEHLLLECLPLGDPLTKLATVQWVRGAGTQLKTVGINELRFAPRRRVTTTDETDETDETAAEETAAAPRS